MSVPEKVFPLWPMEEPVDISVYVSELLALPPLSSEQMVSSLVFNQKNFQADDWSEHRSVTVDIPLSQHVQNNGSLFAHIYVSRSGAAMDPTDPDYDASKAFRIISLLTKYMPKKKIVKTKKLIGGDHHESEEEEEEEEVPLPDNSGSVVSYFHPNLTLDVVNNADVIGFNTLPPPLRQHVVLEATGARDSTGKNGWYYPVVFVNEFWQLKDHMIELNSTVKYVSLLRPLSNRANP